MTRDLCKRNNSTRMLELALLLVGAALYLLACGGGESSGTPSSGDPQKADNGAKTCADVDGCVIDCDGKDTACQDACIAQGSADVQAQARAVLDCVNRALPAACKDKCGAEPSEACGECLDQQCGTELTACYGAQP